jgi:putative PIN family toxin of toxin-antitoxin system
MNPEPHLVVFDCNIFLQAMISPNGPASKCLELARSRQLKLVVSDYVLAEVRDLPNDRKVAAKFGLTVEKAERFIANLVGFAQHRKDVPPVYRHPRDPDDSHYVDLALAEGAKIIVSRDRHLLNLMDPTDQDAQEFQRRFPTLRILEPVGFLQWISNQSAQE